MGSRRNQNQVKTLLSWMLGLVALPALAAINLGSTDNLIEPEKAFRFSAQPLDASTVEVRFEIAEGYYLYRERFRFAAAGGVRLGAPEFPQGIPHKDEFFGDMHIYRKEVRIRLPAQGAGS